MRSRFRPCIEQLESQTLLSGVLPAFTPTLVHSDPFEPAVLPAPAPALALKVTTDRAVYRAGQPVQVTITATNTSDQVVPFSPESGFLITRNGQAVWQANPLPKPGQVQDFVVLGPVLLRPGQSYTIRDVWDGHSNDAFGDEGPLVTGTFHVWSRYAVGQQRTGGPPAVPATITVLPAPAPSLAVKVTTNRAVYLAGQPVQVTITVTNTSNQDFLLPLPGNEFLITRNGQTVFGGEAQIFNPIAFGYLDPGQSYTVRLTWDGHSNGASGHEGPLVTGTFHVWSEFAVRQQRTGGPPAVPVTITILPVPTPAAQG
jgi:hypothetical protein